MRFGLIGAGHWAEMAHAPAIAAATGARLVGVWSRRPEAAGALAARYDTHTFDDVDALIDAVDAVAFCVPPDVQAVLATRAAAAGRHLLLEKPIAFTRAAGDRLAATASAVGVRSVVFFTAHFQPDVRDWLADLQPMSDWDGATAHRLGSAFYPGSPWAASRWRRERGGLWDIGPHVVAALLAVLGPIDRVCAERGPRDAVTLLLHHAGGATSTATVSSDAPAAVNVTDVVVWGRRGRSSMPPGILSPEAALSVAVRELVDGRNGCVGPPCDLQFGCDVLEVIDAAAQQMASRGQVDPPWVGGAGDRTDA